jgi:hypothetical protein
VGVTPDVGGFQFRDPPLELMVQTPLSRQSLLHALELPGLLLVALVLGLDDPPLMLAEDSLLVGEFFEQPLDVADRGLRPLVIKFVELLASQHWRRTSGAREVASGQGRKLEKRRGRAMTRQ